MAQNGRGRGRGSGLPARPAGESAGPSRHQPYPTPVANPSFAPSSMNLSGGYGGYAAAAPVYNPAYGYNTPQMYSQYPAYPYQAYGSYPAMPNPYQSFGQSLFYQPQAQAAQQIPHYPQMPAPVPVEPPSKRQKVDALPSMADDPMAWRNCSQKGCKFVGPGDKVEQHEGDRHLIFKNGSKVELSEEEQRYANHRGPPPPVFGTSITLHTEEQIAKWIADRKAKWPGAKRVAERKAEREAAIVRGENPDRKGKRDRRAADPAAAAEDWGRSEAPPSGADRGGRGRGRGSERSRGRGDREGGGPGRGRGGKSAQEGRGGAGGDRGGRGRGRGRGGVDAGRHQDAGYSGASAALADKASTTTSTLPARPEAQVEAAAPPSGLAVVGEYDSDSDSDSSSSSSSGDSLSSLSTDEEGAPKASVPVAEPEAVEKSMCAYWQKNGRCKFGDACSYDHPADLKVDESPVPAPRKQIRQPPQKKPNHFARPSLLGQLHANPIQNTLSQLTQTIRFLVANDMLNGVELEPGQAEAEQRKRELIQEIPPPEESS